MKRLSVDVAVVVSCHRSGSAELDRWDSAGSIIPRLLRLVISLSFPWPDTPTLYLVSTCPILYTLYVWLKQPHCYRQKLATTRSYLNALCSFQRCHCASQNELVHAVFSVSFAYPQFCCFLSSHGWWMSGSGSHSRMNSSDTAHLQYC